MRFSSKHVVIIAALGFLLLGVFGVIFLNHLSRLESMIEAMGEQVNRAVGRVEEAVDLSQHASQRAEEAERNALEAARGRDEAYRAMSEAERARRDALTESERAREEARQDREEIEKIQARREEEMNRLNETLGQFVNTRRTPGGLIMTLGSDAIQFDFDRAQLRPAERELLSRIAGVLLTAEGYRINIYGHTDDIGTDEYNQELSEKRAKVVRDYLVEAGIDPDIITAKGFGKSNPLVEGTTAEARAQNRRVEIGIVDTIVRYEAPLREGEND